MKLEHIPGDINSQNRNFWHDNLLRWRAKFGGMDASMISQMKALKDRSRQSN